MAIYLEQRILTNSFWSSKLVIIVPYKTQLLIVPTFKENGLFMLGVVFFQSIFADRINSFRQKLFYPIEDIDFLIANWIWKVLQNLILKLKLFQKHKRTYNFESQNLS